MTITDETGRFKAAPILSWTRTLGFLLDWGTLYYFLHGSMYLYLAIWGSRSLKLYNYYKHRHDVAFFNPLQLEAWQWWLILGGTLFLTVLIRTFGRSLGQRAFRFSLQSTGDRSVSIANRLARVALWPAGVLASPIQALVTWATRRTGSQRLLHDRLSRTTIKLYVRPAHTPRKKIWKTQWGWVVAALLVITFVLGWVIIDASFGSLLSPSEETRRQVLGFIHPDFAHLTTPEPALTQNRSAMEAQKFSIVNLMVITMLMALVATILGALLAFPLSFLGARNLMGGSRIGIAVYTVVRGFFNMFRSIEILFWVSMFAAWLMYGNAFTGVMALVIHTIAALGKLYSEQVESIASGPIEAIQATGGSKLQIVRFAVIPQIVPSFLAFTLYRWEINVRMATIVSLVGGGGIGELLFWYRHQRNFTELGAVILAIIAVVWTLDYISGRVRERIV